ATASILTRAHAGTRRCAPGLGAARPRVAPQKRTGFSQVRERPRLRIRSVTARIVVVEDDPSVAELVTLYLRNAEFIVDDVRAVLRRAAGLPGGGRTLEVGNLRVDPARHEVHVGDRSVSLRAKEFELLEAFCRQPGIVLTRDRLLEEVWGFAYPGETRTVDVHVKQLRDKLTGAEAKIETVWGVGYKLVAPA